MCQEHARQSDRSYGDVVNPQSLATSSKILNFCFEITLNIIWKKKDDNTFKIKIIDFDAVYNVNVILLSKLSSR